MSIFAAVQFVRFWHKADITALLIYVRFRGQSGHSVLRIVVTQNDYRTPFRQS
jgi:hypothetical protein